MTNETSMDNFSTTLSLAEIDAFALSVFGSKKTAHDWLNSFNLILGDTPVHFMDEQNGTDEVHKILHSIAYGGVV